MPTSTIASLILSREFFPFFFFFFFFLQWVRKPSLFSLENGRLNVSTLCLWEGMENWSHPVAPSCIFSAAASQLHLIHQHTSMCISSSKSFFFSSPLPIFPFSFLLWGFSLLLVFTIILLRPQGRGKIKICSQNTILEADMLMTFFSSTSSFLWASWGPQERNGVWQRVHGGDQGCVQLQRRLPPPGRCRGHCRMSGDRPMEQPQCPPTVCPWVLG